MSRGRTGPGWTPAAHTVGSDESPDGSDTSSEVPAGPETEEDETYYGVYVVRSEILCGISILPC